MHLPPIECLYPYTIMAMAVHPLNSPVSTGPPALSSPATQSPPVMSAPPSELSISALNRLLRRVLARPQICILGIEEIDSHGILPTYLLTTSDEASSHLLLTLPPGPHVKLLRIEQYALETQVQLYQILDGAPHLGVSVPRVLAYDLSPKTLRGTPFLLTTYVPGPRLSGHATELGDSSRQSFTRQMSSLVSSISGQPTSNPSFGSLHGARGSDVATGSWFQAFGMMLEGILRDGEDMLVSLPYETIRSSFSRLSGALDEVREARLVLMSLGTEEGSKGMVLDEDGTKIIGLTGCGSWVAWADPLLARVFDGPLEEVEMKYGGGDEATRRML